jgi:hypothetical protein
MKWAVRQTGKLQTGAKWLMAVAVLAAATVSQAHAREVEQQPMAEQRKEHPPGARPHHFLLQNPAGGNAAASNGPQRDGHLSPAERKLLRQHIEDADRNIYKH